MPSQEIREPTGDAEPVASERLVEGNEYEDVAGTLADLEDERWFAVEHEQVEGEAISLDGPELDDEQRS